MNKQSVIIGLVALFFFGYWMPQEAQSQELAFDLEAGVSNPTISITDLSNPSNLPHVKPGFNIRFNGTRFFENRFFAGIHLGYALYGMDKEAIEDFLNPPNANLLSLDVDNYQVINVMASGGYSLSFLEEKLFINPYVSMGLGALNSASYLVKYNDPSDPYQIYRSGGTGASFVWAGGVNARYGLNEVIYLGAYFDYYFGDFTNSETTGVVGNIDPSFFPKTDITYQLRTVNAGLGLSLIL